MFSNIKYKTWFYIVLFWHRCSFTTMTRTVTYINQIYHLHCSQITDEHSQPPPRPPSLYSRSRRSQMKDNMKNLRTKKKPRTSCVLANFWIWRGPWFIAGPLSLTPLTAAATQIKRRASKLSHVPKVVLRQMPFQPQPSLFSKPGDSSKYVRLRSLRLSFKQVTINF